MRDLQQSLGALLHIAFHQVEETLRRGSMLGECIIVRDESDMR